MKRTNKTSSSCLFRVDSGSFYPPPNNRITYVKELEVAAVCGTFGFYSASCLCNFWVDEPAIS